MIRITIQTGAHTYRISNQSHEHDGYPWRGRLLNVPELELLGKVTDQENPIREIPLAIDNHDGFIDIDTDSIWNATVTYENDNYADTWVGILARYSQSGEGTLSIQATEQTQALFKLMIPDEVVRIANYTDAPRDAANITIPMIFGGTAASPIRTKAILVDRANFRYMVCLGEVRQIVAVLKNRTVITEGFTAYTGASDQATYPGFAYIEFAADPRDDAGVWPELLVDVVGLKLGAHTEEECRNPARILYYLLTTARTGACGWGLGRNVSELDAASFAQAITDCDSAGFKIDGLMDEQKYAPQWIDRITSACRGAFGIKAGKWALTIDKVSASVKHYGTGYAKMRVSTRGKGSMTNRKNQFILNYRYDATDGRFLGFAQRDDSTSQTALGTVSKFEDTNKLVSDHTAAGYIVDYYKRYEEYGEDRIEFTTNDFSGVSKDSVIQITRPDFGYSAKKFRVVSISISKRTAKIEARSYDDAIFENDTPGTPPADPDVDPIPVPGSPNPPESPADVSIQTNVRVQPDGTVIGYADIYFTPHSLALFTRIEVGEGATPSTWTELGVIGESGAYHHEPAKVGQNYTYRLTSVNTGGSSASVTANITIAADTTAPLVPQAPILSTYFKSIAVKCLQNLTKAPDHASFDVYRNTTNNSGTATKIGSAPCLGNTDSVVYLDEATAFDTTYYYWVKSVDTSGNISGFSAVAGPVSTQRIIAGDIGTSALNSSALFASGVVDAAAIADCAVTAQKTNIAAISRTTGNLNAGVVGTTQMVDSAITNAKIASGALAMPIGAVASYSAKGSTTAEISVSGGYKDVSGRGNHLTAFCGVSVVQDAVFGSVFAFDGVDSYAAGAATPFINHCCFSVSWRQKVAGIAPGMTGAGYWDITYLPNARANTDGLLQIAIKNGNNQTVYLGDCTSHFDDQWHHFVFTATCSCLCLFRDGVFVSSNSIAGINWPWATSIYFGNNINNGTEFLCGCIAQWKFFNRALSAAEVKSLYQFPDDVVFGNITADLLAANSVTASKICSGSVCACHLGVCAVTADAIAAGAVVAGKIASDSIYGCNIIAGTICAAQIGACQILACNLAAGIITSASIISTGITGACICAGTITASHLLVAASGSSLNDDPAFADSSAWKAYSGSLYFCSVTDGKVGNTVLRSYSVGTAAWALNEKFIPFDCAKTYRVRMWVRKSATANGTYYMSWRTFDSSCIGIPANMGYYIVSSCTLPTTNWTEMSVLVGSGTSYPGTSDARYMKIGTILNYGGTAGYMEAQDFRIEEVLPATLIQDGAITTAKIAANSICAGHICSGAITTAHLTASGICADCIKAGTLSGVTVCACTGKIGGWTVNTEYLSYDCPCVAAVYLYPRCYGYQLGLKNASNSYCGWITHGKMLWGTNYQNAVGFSASCGSGTTYGVLTFAAGHALTGGITLPDTSTVAAGCPFFWVGDSGAFVKYNAGVLTVKGSITITGGSGIANFTDAGALATVDSLDGVPDGTSYVRTTPNQACGASKGFEALISSIGVWGVRIADTRSVDCPPCAYTAGRYAEFKCSASIGISGADTYGALETVKSWGDSSGGYATQTYKDSTGVYRRRAPAGNTLWCAWYRETDGTGALVSRVIPKNKAAPGTGSGLFLGCDYMGYYNGSAWKTYMDKDGRFYLTGASGGLAWDGSALTVCGTVCATAGCFTGALNATSGCFGAYYIGACCVMASTIAMSSGTCCAYYTWISNASCLNMQLRYACCSTGCTTGYSLGTLWPYGLKLRSEDAAGTMLAEMNMGAYYFDVCSYFGTSSSSAPINVQMCCGTGCWGFHTNGKVNATGGFTTCSDRRIKERIGGVCVLQKIRSLTISEWSFKDNAERRIGPMAQDFYRAFPMHGSNPEIIGSLDGIALKAAQELDGCVGCLNSCVGCLQTCIRSLESRLANLEARLPACA